MGRIFTIDCHYVYPEIAAAFLLEVQGEAAFIENNTSQALPHLLSALEKAELKPEQVKYLIITHVHLDHAGGTGALLRHCPGAKVVAHPKAARHIIEPGRLIESAKKVYGEELFHKLYGEIIPVPQEKVLIPGDKEKLLLADHELYFFYTRGHANHHFVVYDAEEKIVFTGDSFGIAYPALQKGSYPFIYPSTTPTDFDPEEAHKSYDLIASLGAKKAMLTHFGEFTDIEFAQKELHRLLSEVEEIYNSILEKDLSYEEAVAFAEEKWQNLFSKELEKRKIHPTQEEWDKLKIDLGINAQGVAFSALRKKKKSE